jgi:hypothetical protein
MVNLTMAINLSNLKRLSAGLPDPQTVALKVKEVPLPHYTRNDSYKKCYEKWVGRWQLCLDKERDYVEK